MTIDFVIPFRDMGDERRNKTLEWAKARLHKSFPSSNIFAASDYPLNERFNRSQAINLAANMAIDNGADMICIIDADTVFNPEVVLQGATALQKGAPWVLPYDTYYRTDKKSADKILQLNPTTRLFHGSFTYTHVFGHPPTIYNEVVSGVVMVRSEDFKWVGGFNEGFDGWGYEDRGWQVAADLCLGPYERLEGNVFHLWHDEPIETTESQPRIQENSNLYQSMMATSTPTAMRRAIRGEW